MEIIWYDEQDLTLELRTERGTSVSHIARELLGAPTFEDRSQIVRAMLAVAGFSSLAYMTLRLVDRHPVRACLMRSYMPARYQEHYFRERYYEVDPRRPLDRSYRPPVIWDLSQLRSAASRNSPDRRLGKLIEDMESSGMLSGIMFGIPGQQPGLCSLVSLTSANARHHWINDDTLAQSLALGFAIHQLASGYARVIATQSRFIDLSGKQRSIIACLVSGMSNRQIAARLQTTSRVVNSHLRLLQDRFEVSGRTQLAFVAGKMQLV